jgi:hypothetical protein
MVDNVTTPTTGTGTATPVIATDDVSGVHYQRMKITDGTADSAVHLKVAAEDSASADGDTGLVPMAVRRAAPVNSSGTDGDYEPLQMNNGALWVSPLGFPKTIKVDITRPADTTAYAAGDAMSNSTTAPTSGGFTLTDAARKSGGSGIITDVCVASSNDPGTRLNGEIYFWDQAVTNINDNAAFTVTDAEIKNCIGVVPFSLYDVGANHYSHMTGLNILYTCVGTANLRFLLRVRAAYTPANAEVISITVKMLQLD